MAYCKCYLLLEDPASEFCLSYKVPDRAYFYEIVIQSCTYSVRVVAFSIDQIPFCHTYSTDIVIAKIKPRLV